MLELRKNRMKEKANGWFIFGFGIIYGPFPYMFIFQYGI